VTDAYLFGACAGLAAGYALGRLDAWLRRRRAPFAGRTTIVVSTVLAVSPGDRVVVLR
jgi:hypothetical protein